MFKGCRRRRSMPAMLLLASQLPLLEARLRLVRATLASCADRLPFHCLPLTRERLLRLGAHRRLLEGLRCLAGAALGGFRELSRLCRFVAEEREFLPFTLTPGRDWETQPLPGARARAGAARDRRRDTWATKAIRGNLMKKVYTIFIKKEGCHDGSRGHR